VFILIAAIFIGFVCSAIFYWLVNFSISDAIGLGSSAAISGIATEYLNRYLKRKRIVK
jgi:hypothetical protein